MKKKKGSHWNMLLESDGKPSLLLALPVGLQHILAMFASNLTPILVVGAACIGQNGFTEDRLTYMLSAAMLTSGITSLIQLYPIKIGKSFQIGSGLPIIMGCSNAFVTVAILAPQQNLGMNAVVGAVMVAVFVELCIATFYHKVKAIFNHLVIGVILVAIGLLLIPIGANFFLRFGHASIKEIIIASIVFCTAVGLQVRGGVFLRSISVFIGIVVGALLSVILGVFPEIPDAPLIGFQHLIPLKAIDFRPTFHLEIIIPMLFMFFATAVEDTGNIHGVTLGAFNREASTKEIKGGLFADGFGSLFSSLFNAMPNTSYGQNVGIITATKVVNKFTIATGSVVLIIISFFPQIATYIRLIPRPVFGGVLISIFPMILISGFSELKKVEFTRSNMLIMAISLGVGIGLGGNESLLTILRENNLLWLSYFFSSGIALTGIMAIGGTLLIHDRTQKTKSTE